MGRTPSQANRNPVPQRRPVPCRNDRGRDESHDENLSAAQTEHSARVKQVHVARKSRGTVPRVTHTEPSEPSAGNTLDCVLGLGSNVGDRLNFFRAAVQALARHGAIVSVSALYETVAVGPAQPDYLNAALRLRTPLEPSALLELQLSIERACGRVRLERWGPRTLDIDLLFIAGRTVDAPGLIVPHRELRQRAFALLPLLDVAPDACDPTTGVRYSEVASKLDRTGVRELPDSRAGWLE
jgi:2-amino-4-hydroxy-6-hydroxymethyldihydropteridine diphosphokinase